ncbi:hypothetical protein BB560_002524 [Smittium megazygosporum]|uniref:Vacuolar protein sorting-associated protein 16 homolog n=1 Tax=Smittium megazygosporum TaxID=133381 RepID=A0A2T9ZEQ8_9FUNG|nr:hypothetical protein BB560_002524 [Smittium megazygosporum]
MLQDGPFSHISISPSGKLVALMQKSGKLQVISSDFQKLYSETYPTSLPSFEKSSVLNPNYNRKMLPLDVAWCGNDSVAVSYGTSVFLIGPFGGSIKFDFDSNAMLVSEVDGVRILNSQVHDFIQKVPDSLIQVFQIGSTSSAALLYDAYEHLRNESSKADEIVRSIKKSLGNAIDTCIDAAGSEFSESLQQYLLRAASFGKTFLPEHNPTKFVEMCTNLRILNTVRGTSIGLAISLEEYLALPPESWIQRLLNRNMYFLALKICEHLSIPSAEVYSQWAISKIQQSRKDEDSLYEILLNKLSDVPSLSFIEIAEAARSCAKPKLTTRLLQLEPIAANKVPLLLSIGQYNLSLDEAIKSGNVELVYLVILTSYSELSLGEFFRLISSNKVASLLFSKYCKQQGKYDLLKNYYFQEDEFFKSSELAITANVFESESMEKFKSNIESAIESLGKEARYNIQAKVLNQELKLLNFQIKLEDEIKDSVPRLEIFNDQNREGLLNRNINERLNKTQQGKVYKFVGSTLNQTLCSLILYGLYAKASLMKTEFQIPERAYYLIKIRSLVKRRDFVELEKLGRTKKPPVGYEVFASECIRAGQFQEASKYIALCDEHEKPELYFEIGFLHEAAECALAVKNVELLKKIGRETNDPTLRADIESRVSAI